MFLHLRRFRRPFKSCRQNPVLTSPKAKRRAKDVCLSLAVSDRKGLGCGYFSAFFSVTVTSPVLSSLAISADRFWAFLPSLLQPVTTLTTLPPLSIRMLAGMAVVSKVFHRSPLGSDSQMNL